MSGNRHPWQEDPRAGQEETFPDSPRFQRRFNSVPNFCRGRDKSWEARHCKAYARVNSLREALARIRKLPQDGDPSVLLVGHGNSGRLLV